MSSLPLDKIRELLADEKRIETTGRKFPPPPQYGPLRHFDKEMTCASRGCSSPTYHKVNGIPYCMIHALRELNEIVIKLS